MGARLIKAAAATIVGRSHLNSGQPCQDAVAIARRRHATCIALADGAGSKPRSDVGARAATATAAYCVAEKFDEVFELAEQGNSKAARWILGLILAALVKRNRRRRENLNVLACTLMFAAYRNGRYVAGHIGDGVIGVRQNGRVAPLSKPENGEFANSTYFVTDPDAERHFRIYSGTASADFSALLMSDGTAASLYQRQTGQLAAAVGSLMTWADRLPLSRLPHVLRLNLEQAFRPRTVDDCSVAILAVG